MTYQVVSWCEYQNVSEHIRSCTISAAYQKVSTWIGMGPCISEWKCEYQHISAHISALWIAPGQWAHIKRVSTCITTYQDSIAYRCVSGRGGGGRGVSGSEVCVYHMISCSITYCVWYIAIWRDIWVIFAMIRMDFFFLSTCVSGCRVMRISPYHSSYQRGFRRDTVRDIDVILTWYGMIQYWYDVIPHWYQSTDKEDFLYRQRRPSRGERDMTLNGHRSEMPSSWALSPI